MGGGVLRGLEPSRGSRRGSAFLQAGTRFSASRTSLLVTSVSVSDYYILVLALSRCFGLLVAYSLWNVEHSLACGALCESAGPLV